MTNQELIEQITPVRKKIKAKGGSILVLNDKLVSLNEDKSLMYVTDVTPTSMMYANTVTHISNGEYDNNLREYNIVLNLYQQYMSYPILFREEGVDQYPDFPDILSMRAKDPRTHYEINGLYIPIFYGLLPMNKGDRLDINILDMNPVTSVVRYDVYKKALKRYIYIYTKLLTVTR